MTRAFKVDGEHSVLGRKSDEDTAEGSFEWAAQQTLLGRPVVLTTVLGEPTVVRTFGDFLALCVADQPQGRWHRYVEPASDYVAKVGTDVWAFAMLLEGKSVRHEDMLVTTTCDFDDYVGEGLVWQLA